ncbi:hypothetical protein TNIN_9211, partial [Trichonephila inaurata madagascariensis]
MEDAYEFKESMKRAIGAVLNKWPGKERFGVYRFLPLFFIFGAALEFTMIKWEFHGVNFFILQTSSFSLLLHFVLFLNMDISFIIAKAPSWIPHHLTTSAAW